MTGPKNESIPQKHPCLNVQLYSRINVITIKKQLTQKAVFCPEGGHPPSLITVDSISDSTHEWPEGKNSS